MISIEYGFNIPEHHETRKYSVSCGPEMKKYILAEIRLTIQKLEK